MRASLVAIGCVAVSVASANIAPQMRGDGNVRSESRSVGKFDRVSLLAGAQLIVHVGKPTSVKVTSDGNILPIIVTKVSRGELIIESTMPYQTQRGVRVEVSTPSLAGLQIKGSGDVNVTGVAGKQFVLGIPGSAKVVMAGKVDSVVVSIQGSADVNLFGLQASRSQVMIQGSANVKTAAKDALQVNIQGSGNVTYRGNPSVTKSIQGSGNVMKER